MKPLLLRLHRWITLLFALPLAVVVVTGLILSFEPIAMDTGLSGRSVPLARIEQALDKFDPGGKATTLTMRAYEGVAVISERRGPGGQRVELDTLSLVPPGKRLWSDVFTTSRRLHESLLLDLKWLVDTSSAAMIVLMAIGLAMGLPFFRNSLGGWHRVTAWGLAPLLILSPLTGLAIAFGVTLSPPAARPEGGTVTLREAVRTVAARHDLANVVWIRPMGGAMRARVYDGKQAKVFTVTRAGLVAGPQNWPRVWHEGVFAGAWSGLMNVVISLALMLLMVTGLWIWLRRRMRPRRVRAAHTA